MDRLRDALEQRLAQGRITFDVLLEPENGAGLGWLYENTEVLQRTTAANGSILLSIRTVPERAELVRRKFLAAAAEERPQTLDQAS
jgi:GTP-binding protein HflX